MYTSSEFDAKPKSYPQTRSKITDRVSTWRGLSRKSSSKENSVRVSSIGSPPRRTSSAPRSESLTARSSSTTRIFIAPIVRADPENSLKAVRALTDFLPASQDRLRGNCSHGDRQRPERSTSPMTRRPRPSLIASLLVAACLGAGGGAAVYAVSSSGDTKTVVRQVTVENSQPASRTSGLSVNAIYRRANRGVVDITVSGASSAFGPSQSAQAEGSGFVYDSKGDIVTNQHVVDGAESITVKFWNGKTYKATVVGTDSSTDLAVIRVNAPASQ